MKLKNLSLVLLILLCAFLSLAISVSQKTYENTKEEKQVAAKPVSEQEAKETYCVAKVISVISDVEEELPGGNKQRNQQLLLKILSGKDKGKERVTSNAIPDNPAFAVIGEVGKKYLLTKIEYLKTGLEDYFIVDYYREPFVWSLLVLFLFVLVIVGGFKGIRTIVSLFSIICFVAFLLIPTLEKGLNPLLAAVFISFLSTAVTMLLVAGFNFKSLAATLGTVIGVTLSGFIATFVIKAASLTGLAGTEAMILWANQVNKINFKGLLAAGMIVSCLGAIMDVAISIASSIQEVKIANPTYTFKKLFISGMNVGKDIMGTMTNTLVLAFAGMALPMLILISHEKTPAKFLNLELVVSEITAAISGSIGLILTVPITALLMSFLVSRVKR
jgi:uncharacterized membrane protein